MRSMRRIQKVTCARVRGSESDNALECGVHRVDMRTNAEHGVQSVKCSSAERGFREWHALEVQGSESDMRLSAGFRK